MKLCIGYDEFADVGMKLTFNDICKFLENQFPNWDVRTAFDLRTLEYDDTNREVSIILPPTF